MNIKQILALIMSFILVVNMILVASKLISQTLFWTILIIFGLISYFGFKRLR